MDRLSPGIHPILNVNTIQALNKKQIYTVLDFIKTNSKTIEKATNLLFREILDVRKFLLKNYSPQPRNAFTCYQSIPIQCAIIPSGVKNLDVLLEGGFLTGNIYEICGLPSSGKTYFCITLLKNVTAKMENVVYYLDTKYDFSALKLKKMLSYLSKEKLIEAMKKILVKRIGARHELLSSLHEIKEKLQNGLNLKLLIIDSLASLYMQSADLTDNNAFLNYTANILNYLAIEYNIVIVVTNLMTMWNEGDFKNIGILQERISCGNYWYNVPHVRLKFKSDGSSATVTLMKTIKIMPSACTCQVNFTDSGII